jgi:hypothetical protein
MGYFAFSLSGNFPRKDLVFFLMIISGTLVCGMFMVSFGTLPMKVIIVERNEHLKGATTERLVYFEKYMKYAEDIRNKDGHSHKETLVYFGKYMADFEGIARRPQKATTIKQTKNATKGTISANPARREQPSNRGQANVATSPDIAMKTTTKQSTKSTATIKPDAPARIASLPVVYFDDDMKNFEGVMRGNDPKIPRIIHQTWKTHDVPAEFAAYVKTWIKQNPGWQYWFWSDAEAARFIKFKHPKYYDMYENYPEAIYRADAMRYFVLYEFGGWYADLDIEDLKPLEELGNTHSCIISQEPWGHVLFIWNRTRLACNALMAARPNHPYFKYVIEQLPANAEKREKGLMEITGPKMIDNTLSQYERIMNQSKLHSHSNTVYLADPDCFLPTLSGNGLPEVMKACKSEQSNDKKKRICDRLNKEEWANQPPPESYTNHVWIHTYYHANLGTRNNISVFDLVPTTVNVTAVLLVMETKFDRDVTPIRTKRLVKRKKHVFISRRPR